MLRSILIANRGEIACRIARTCRRLGIRTVAVCSEADAASPHARAADAAVVIGAPPVGESYLRTDRILAAAREHRVDAVHPGYGLLSESPGFARAVEGAGIRWIGPPPEAMEAMALKVASRALAIRCGVPVVPGSEPVGSEDEAVSAARDIGYPVMLKASAGGGGIGMLRCDDEAALRRGFPQTRRRSLAAFGDDAVYIERAVVRPRHVEVQVLFDDHGAGVVLHERECSVQRRHQKVIEEAPSPLQDEALRLRLAVAAASVARAVGYVNAGTVEFIVDGEGGYWFLEMNTRLQVEHPVTEMITGLDLVEQQIRVASGEALAFGQAQVPRRGHAVECRIYAEDPERFLPSPGTLTVFEPPEGEGVRVDHAAEPGMAVTPHYDPLLAKVVTWGEDRAQAIDRMREAIDRFRIEGVRHNLPLHRRILASDAFARGALHTGLLAELGYRI
ncbi:biotin carboxylase [Myxococcota bacterium]|nr:biotin carboxylase [Myxococcota bacterium]